MVNILILIAFVIVGLPIILFSLVLFSLVMMINLLQEMWHDWRNK